MADGEGCFGVGIEEEFFDGENVWVGLLNELGEVLVNGMETEVECLIGWGGDGSVLNVGVGVGGGVFNESPTCEGGAGIDSEYFHDG